MKNNTHSILLLTLFALAMSFNAQSQIKAGGTCNKACLFDITEQYLEAMVSGSLEGLPLAGNVRVTSNSTVIKAGQGPMWEQGIASIENRYTFVDPRTQTAIFYGVIAGGSPGEWDEERIWWYYSLRLSLDSDGNIFEIEDQISAGTIKDRGQLQRPFKEEAIFSSVLPEDERVDAAGLIRAANSYFDALTAGNGVDGLFSPDCQRSEFGNYTTNTAPEHLLRERFESAPALPGSCRNQFGLDHRFHWPVDNRRHYIIDEARGVIVSAVQFHKFDAEDAIAGLSIMEAFKVVNGRIDFIWAPVFNFGLEESGWPDWERPAQ